jgi:hypothetical protein
MKGFTFIRVMMNPFKAPRTIPNMSPIMKDMSGFTPSHMRRAVSMLHAAKIDPTERSIPPVMMTIVIPTEMIAMEDIFLKTLKIFSALKK